jgi:hypothetical protein
VSCASKLPEYYFVQANSARCMRLATRILATPGIHGQDTINIFKTFVLKLDQNQNQNTYMKPQNENLDILQQQEWKFQRIYFVY